MHPICPHTSKLARCLCSLPAALFVLTATQHQPAGPVSLLQVDRDASKMTRVAPLPHMFVVKDLVVDMANFYAQYKHIQPYLQTTKPKP